MSALCMVERVCPRRAFLISTGVVAVGAVVDAFVVEPKWLEVTRHEVPIAGLPQRLDGFTLAQISDVHLNELGTVEEAVLRVVRTESIQLILLTGDIVESTLRLRLLEDFCGALRKTGTTVLATLGNWEHWGKVPVDELSRSYARVGAKLLVNEGVFLPDGMRVYATDDATGGRPQLGPLFDPHEAPTLLATHSPALLDSNAFKPGAFGLALSGHTHGGQMRMGPNGVPFRPFGCGRFVGGWYHTPGGRAYVSRGTGTSIVPARFTCRPELPVFRLHRA